MDLIAVVRVSVHALARNKLRSILTMLGITIGVGAVSEDTSGHIQRQIRTLGDNMIWIEAGGRNLNGRNLLWYYPAYKAAHLDPIGALRYE